MADDPRATPGTEQLRRALRAVPADEPGPHFTAGVLARLGRAPAAARWRPSLLPAWAVAAVVLFGLAGGWGVVNHRAAAAERRRAELRSETAAIAAELAALREEATRSAPVLYLGGTEEVDLVLDLATLPVAAALRTPGAGADRLPN